MKIAIVCTAPGSEHLAPFDDPEYKIWALGTRAKAYKRIDRIFEIHDDLTNYERDSLLGLNTEIIVGENSPLIGPNVRVFPFEEVKSLMTGMNGEHYLTSSVAYMMAMAILEDPEEISIFGVDMSITNEEYFHQRPCMEAWMGFARGRGIKVSTPSVCPIFKSRYVYGSEDWIGDIASLKAPFTEKEFLKMAEIHEKRHEQFMSQLESLKAQIQTNDGARQAYKAMARAARAVEDGNEIQSLTHTVLQRS